MLDIRTQAANEKVHFNNIQQDAVEKVSKRKTKRSFITCKKTSGVKTWIQKEVEIQWCST